MIRVKLARLTALTLVCALLAACGPKHPGRQEAGRSASRHGRGRLIVLGFDGVDPRWLDRWVAEGQLPTMKRLVQAHGGRAYRPLTSTIPPQSPVAWASFATGTNPGEHGIFDFIRPSRTRVTDRP